MSGQWLTDVVIVPTLLSIGTGVYTGFLVGRIVNFQNELQRARERALTLPDRLGEMINHEEENEAALRVTGFYVDISSSLIHAHGQVAAGKHMSRSSLIIQNAMVAIHRSYMSQRNLAMADHSLIEPILDAHFENVRRLMHDALDEINLIKPDWNVIMLGTWAKRPSKEKEQGI